MSYFADFLPPMAFELLSKTTVELATGASGGKLTFGIVAALWIGSGGVNSMISALNLAYRVQEARSWLKVRMIALGLTFSISIFLLLRRCLSFLPAAAFLMAGDGAAVAASRRSDMEGSPVAGRRLLRTRFLFADLFFWPASGETPLALAHSRLGIWRYYLAPGVSWIQGVFPLLQQLQLLVWIAWRRNDSIGLAVCNRTGIFDRRGNQRRDRPRDGTS